MATIECLLCGDKIEITENGLIYCFKCSKCNINICNLSMLGLRQSAEKYFLRELALKVRKLSRIIEKSDDTY